MTDLSPVKGYDVTSVPALVLFEDGERVDHLAEGVPGTEALIAFVEEHAERDPTAAGGGTETPAKWDR